MRGRLLRRLIFGILLIFQLSICLAAKPPDTEKGSKYLEAVREFADNVLKYGRDTYGPKHTPLFVDGLNIHTHEPVKWISPEGERWVLSNLASQQNLFRVLDGLTTITGDPKYRQAAMEAIEYALQNLRSPNGLLYWGGHVAYDAGSDQPCGGTEHELKFHYPYYKLMWRVDPDDTKKLIEALWCAHVYDWSNLDFDRIGITTANLEEPWNHEYDEEAPTFFKSKYGGSGFSVTGSSLVHAGTTLYRLSHQQQPLVWGKRLAKRFVDTRHPETGISALIYNGRWHQLGQDTKEHFVDPHTTVFPWDFYEFRYLYYPERAHAHPWLSMFLVGKMLGQEGKEFTQWALEELVAWVKASYRKKDNSFVPILTDGTSIEGYVFKQDSSLGPRGSVAKPYFADLSFFWAYSVAYCKTGDKFMWEMVRDVALGNSFGDIGQMRLSRPELQTNTTCSHAYGIFGFLELYAKTKRSAFLEMAQRIGDNILSSRFHSGFFLESKRHIYSRFGCFEPLALLHLSAVMKSTPRSVPQAWPGIPLFIAPYRHKERGIDRRIIYTLTESSEPPLSLQEAAAIGDVELVRSLLDKGVGVDSWDDPFKKTALHRAVITGHKDVVELLLAQGADIEAGKFYIGTALHYSANQGYKEIVEYLVSKGADVDAKDNRGRTPLDIAVDRGHIEIVELLRKHGAKQ